MLQKPFSLTTLRVSVCWKGNKVPAAAFNASFNHFNTTISTEISAAESKATSLVGTSY